MTSGVREERLKELAGKLLDSIKTGKHEILSSTLSSKLA